MTQQTLAEKYGAPVPRYTSYPTAPHFHDGIGEAEYRTWLSALTARDTLSLYVHIPFCDRLCWFCGCHTKQTLRYDPLAAYIAPLLKEVDLVANAVPEGPKVTALHFGGGSPSMLTAEDFSRIVTHLRQRFTFADNLEFSLEADPGDMTPDRIDAMSGAGLTRVSIGVQDFDEKVQAAINRPQTYAQTEAVVDAARATGVHSVNLDVLYGLPHQTVETVAKTVEQVLMLDPDRIALFGYAHVPWMKKHQTMINEATLPGINERFDQAQNAAEMLVAGGYERIGFDHFAKPDDTLAIAARAGTLRRNFQGYTDDPASALIGLGASSIGETLAGYAQNITATGQYIATVNDGKLPIARGVALSATDKARRWAIERLMCDMTLSRSILRQRFGRLAEPIVEEAAYLAASDTDGLFVDEGELFRVTEKGRPFVRVLASHFDTYLREGKARHSVAV